MTKRTAWNRKAFTILELMAAVVILTIVVSMSSVGYSRYRDRAAMLVDETNEKVHLATVKLYAYDNNALPGSLSQVTTEQLQRAYAQVMEGKQPYTLLAYLQEQLGLLDIAEAAGPLDKYFGGTQQQILKILTCPMDRTPPEIRGGKIVGASYGITTGGANGAAGKPLSWLLLPANADLPIIVESDRTDPTPADYALRHNGGKTFVQAAAGGQVTRITSSSGVGPNLGGATSPTGGSKEGG